MDSGARQRLKDAAHSVGREVCFDGRRVMPRDVRHLVTDEAINLYGGKTAAQVMLRRMAGAAWKEAWKELGEIIRAWEMFGQWKVIGSAAWYWPQILSAWHHVRETYFAEEHAEGCLPRHLLIGEPQRDRRLGQCRPRNESIVISEDTLDGEGTDVGTIIHELCHDVAPSPLFDGVPDALARRIEAACKAYRPAEGEEMSPASFYGGSSHRGPVSIYWWSIHWWSIHHGPERLDGWSIPHGPEWQTRMRKALALAESLGEHDLAFDLRFDLEEETPIVVERELKVITDALEHIESLVAEAPPAGRAPTSGAG